MISSPIEHRAAKVSWVYGLSTVLGMGSQLVSVPICLHYWGKEPYGAWLALSAAFLLLRGLDGGYTAFVGNKLNYLYHQNIGALHRHLASAVFGVAIIGVLQLAMAVGTLVLDPLSALLGMPPGHDEIKARFGLLAMMISWVLTGSYLGIVHRLLIPAGLMYQSAWWAMAMQICQFGAIMLSAVFRLNVFQTSLAFAFAQSAICVASAAYVGRALPRFSPWLRGADRRVGLRDLGQSLFLTLSNLVQQGALNGSVLLVSALGGPVAVPAFTTVRTLTNLWTTVTTILTTPLLPDVVRMHANGEVQKLIAINQAHWAVVGSAVNLGALLSYPLIPLLYGRWTAHAVVLDNPLLCMLLGSVVVANSGALMAMQLNGINSLGIVFATSLARAALSLGGGAIFYSRYGLTGFGIGILAGEVVATLMTVRYFALHEITAKGAQLSAAGFGPAGLCTGSVLLYFVGAGLRWWAGGWIWMLTLVSAIGAAIWGWNTLDRELQSRLKRLPLRLVGLYATR
jgi:O-antigen/teichoic acid export membrane protein